MRLKAKETPDIQVKGVYNGKFYEVLFCEPDKVFGIERSDGKKAYFFLETYMGVGQPLSRATPFTSSIRKKHVCYDLVFKANLHKLQLNVPNFRVLFVTNKDVVRAKNIIEEIKITQGPNIFLSEPLRHIEDPYTYRWQDRNGETETILS